MGHFRSHLCHFSSLDTSVCLIITLPLKNISKGIFPPPFGFLPKSLTCIKVFAFDSRLSSIMSRGQEQNIAKGTTDPRVEFILQVLTQILIIFHLQNLEQVSTSQSQANMNISTKVKLQKLINPSFRIFSTKIQLHNPYKTSAEKTDQTPASNLALNSTSKSRQSLVLKV